MSYFRRGLIERIQENLDFDIYISTFGKQLEIRPKRG